MLNFAQQKAWQAFTAWGGLRSASLLEEKVREGGGAVSSRIVMAAAKGFVQSHDPTKLVN